MTEPVNQPADQPGNRSTNQSVSQSVSADALPVVELGPPVFTGPARWSDLAAAVGAPGPLAVVLTTFEAGSGTAWHSHAHPQVLVVTVGTGVLQQQEGPERVLGPGEVVVVPAGVVHRHAAGAGGAMTHVSVSVPGDLRLSD